MPSCREMADTDSPCRCKSKIITSSPSLITVPLLPPIGAASAMVRRLASPKRTLGTSGFIKTGEFSNAAFEENAPATHTRCLETNPRPHQAGVAKPVRPDLALLERSNARASGSLGREKRLSRKPRVEVKYAYDEGRLIDACARARRAL